MVISPYKLLITDFVVFNPLFSLLLTLKNRKLIPLRFGFVLPRLGKNDVIFQCDTCLIFLHISPNAENPSWSLWRIDRNISALSVSKYLEEQESSRKVHCTKKKKVDPQLTPSKSMISGSGSQRINPETIFNSRSKNT